MKFRFVVVGTTFNSLVIPWITSTFDIFLPSMFLKLFLQHQSLKAVNLCKCICFSPRPLSDKGAKTTDSEGALLRIELDLYRLLELILTTLLNKLLQVIFNDILHSPFIQRERYKTTVCVSITTLVARGAVMLQYSLATHILFPRVCRTSLTQVCNPWVNYWHCGIMSSQHVKPDCSELNSVRNLLLLFKLLLNLHRFKYNLETGQVLHTQKDIFKSFLKVFDCNCMYCRS